MDVRSLGCTRISEAVTLADADVYAKNTLAEQDRVTPAANASAALADGILTIELPPVSWTAAALTSGLQIDQGTKALVAWARDLLGSGVLEGKVDHDYRRVCPNPRRPLLVRHLDGGLAGSRRVRKRRAPADGRRPCGPQARGARRLRGELPRQRRVRLRRDERRAGREDRRIPQGAGRDRAGGDHGHHQPVRAPDLQGRGVHGERAH